MYLIAMLSFSCTLVRLYSVNRRHVCHFNHCNHHIAIYHYYGFTQIIITHTFCSVCIEQYSNKILLMLATL